MKPRVITWPAPSNVSIAALQTLGAAGNLTLNGPLVLPGANNPPIVFPGYTRTVTLTSLNNLGGVNFTINGVLNNAPLTEVLAGPNNNTVTSVNIYDAIISITASAAAAGVSAGTGSTGRTKWISADYDMLVGNISVSVVVSNTINYTLSITLDDPNIVTSPALFQPFPSMTGATTNQLGTFTYPTNYMVVTINSSGTTGSLVATFLQQGIAS